MAISWSTLSERGEAILRLVAIPSSEGFSEVEIAKDLRISRLSIAGLLDELAAELRGQLR